MGRSPGFASTTCDWVALLRLAFATAPQLNCLTLPQTVTRRLIMQKARGQALSRRIGIIALPQLVGVWFQVLLTPLIGVLFIVHSRYFSLSVVEEYLALEGGPPRFTQSSTRSVLFWNTGSNTGLSLSHTGLSPSTVPLSRGFCWRCLCNCLPVPTTPGSKPPGLG